MASRVFKTTTAEMQQSVLQRVLVVDDSRAQRRILSSYLTRWGYSVIEAGSGDEALAICQKEDIDLIVSDWMMPGMDGLEFCQYYRALDRQKYGYFILLTSKSEKGEVAHGLDVGADDFLTKPVAGDELLARLRAGERILRMEHELTEKNRLVTSTLAEISSLYESLDRDLVEARKLQQSLVRERHIEYKSGQVDLLLRPSGHVGGDLVGVFPIGSNKIGLYSLDVSGHGIASALITARLAAYLSGSSLDQNVALGESSDGSYVALPPSEVAATLNHIMLEEMDTEHYFTLLFAHVNLNTGEVVMTQCGHPHPAVQRADGAIEFMGDGGLPVGLVPDAEYTDVSFKLEPGDRLFLYSDGISECPNDKDEMLEDSGLFRILRKNASQSGAAFFEALMWDLNEFACDRDFPDDISAVLFEYSGKPTH